MLQYRADVCITSYTVAGAAVINCRSGTDTHILLALSLMLLLLLLLLMMMKKKMRVQTMPIKALQQLVRSGHVTRSPGQHEVTPLSANGFRLSASDRQTYRQTDRETDGQTDTQRDLDQTFITGTC